MAMTGNTSSSAHPTTNARRDIVVAAFHTHHEAQKAVRELKDAGFTDEEIGIASQDREGTYQEQTEGSHAGDGAAIGAATGLGAGALWGLGIVAGALPAIGPVIAGGALAAIAASAAGTAVAGGLVGALIGLGLPEEEANYYQREFESGRTVVSVHCGADRFEEARTILDLSNSYDYDRRESDYARNASAQRIDLQGNLIDPYHVPISTTSKGLGTTPVR